jgi:hypothetical protein
LRDVSIDHALGRESHVPDRFPVVMPGLVPRIHVFLAEPAQEKAWMAGIGERKRRRPSDGYART